MRVGHSAPLHQPLTKQTNGWAGMRAKLLYHFAIHCNGDWSERNGIFLLFICSESYKVNNNFIDYAGTVLILIVVGIKKEREKNAQKGKKKREKKGFP